MKEDEINQPWSPGWLPDPSSPALSPDMRSDSDWPWWIALVLGLLIGAGGGVGITLAATNHQASSPTTHSVAVTFDLTDSESFIALNRGDTCSGEGGYSDIGPGAELTVTNQSQTVIATSSLGDGTYNGQACEFTTSVAVPIRESFYGFSVSKRGTITYSATQIQQANWAVALSLGS